MRIVWNEESALAVQDALNDIRKTTEGCERFSGQVLNALREANPDGKNRRLDRIEEQFDRATANLKKLTEEAMGLEMETARMTIRFEEAEGGAIRLLNALITGEGADASQETAGLSRGALPSSRGPGSGGPSPLAIQQVFQPRLRPRPVPIPLPRPVISPAARISPFTITPQWIQNIIINLLKSAE